MRVHRENRRPQHSPLQRARRRLTALVAAIALTAGYPTATHAQTRANTVVGPLMYVSDLGDGFGSTFDVIDTSTGAAIATVDEVALQTAEAINSSGSQVYVAFSGAVQVFDTATDTFDDSIPIPAISDIAFNPSSTQAFVVGSNGVSVIDTAGETILTTIAAGGSGGHIAFDPSGGHAYATDPAGDDVSVIDTATDSVVATIPVGTDPTGIAVNPSGTLAYVTDYRDDTVAVINTSTDTVAAVIPVGANPVNIAVMPNGTQVFVIDDIDDTVSMIDPTTDTITATLALHDESVPANIAFNAAGTLAYITEPNLDWIDIVDTGTDQLTGRHSGGGNHGYDAVLAPTPQPTTTTLTTSSTGTVPPGTPVTLNATIAPSTAGTVQFFDGSTPLGPPAPVDVNTATYTTSSLTPGTHALTAVFTPAASTSFGSTSSAQPLHVTGNSLAIDQAVTKNGTGTVTTTPFTTTGPRLLVAFTSSDGPTAKQTTTVSGAGLTWTLVQRSNAKGGTAEIWTSQAPAPLSNATITSTPKTAGYDQSLTVVAFSNATGIGASSSAGKNKDAPSLSLTTTANGSWVFGVGEDYSNAVARTLGPAQNLVSQWVDATPGETFWVQDETTGQPAGTSVTLNDTAPTADIWNLAAVEIVASGS